MVLGHPGRPLTRAMRVWFVIDTVLVAAAGLQLLVLAAQTERFFAWTIEPPATAALLGASYWGAIPLVWLASRQTRWADARIAVYGVWLFTVLTLITTLVHLDRFHLGDPELTARAAAWAWLVVYLVVPVALPVLVVLQLRVPGGEPPRLVLPARAFRLAVGVLAALAAGTGALLYAAPGAVPWPWPLTSLTSQALGAWFIGIAVILAQLGWENDWRRVRIALPGLIVLGVLYLAVVLGYAGSIDWTNPFAAGLVVFALGLTACGGYGWRAARRAATILTAAGPG